MADEPAAPVEEPKAPDNEPTSNEPVQKTDDWQAKARKHERDLKNERKAREALESQLAEVQQASQSETEKTLAKARKEAADAAKAEVTQAFRDRILRSEVRAQATGKFADPDDAISLLKLEHDEVFDDDGEVQADVLAKQLDALLERKPHLRADPTQGRPMGDVDAGKGAGGERTGTPEQQHNEWLAGVLRQA